MKTHILLALAAIAVASCSALGPSTEQIKAMEGTSSSFCLKAPGWNGSPIESHYSSFGGKSTGTGGGGGKAACGASVVEFDNNGRAAPAKAAP